MRNDVVSTAYLAGRRIAAGILKMPKTEEGTISIEHSGILIKTSDKEEHFVTSDYRKTIIESLVCAVYGRFSRYTPYPMAHTSILKAITTVDISVLERLCGNPARRDKLKAYLELSDKTIDMFHKLEAGKNIVHVGKDITVDIRVRTVQPFPFHNYTVVFGLKTLANTDTIEMPYVRISYPSALFSLLQHTRQAFKSNVINATEQHTTFVINSQPVKMVNSIKKSLVLALEMGVPVNVATAFEV